MKEVSQRIHKNIRRVRNEIFLLPQVELAYKPKPEKWSRKEILGHLIDSAHFNHIRFTEVPNSQAEVYHIRPYDQDQQVLSNDYQSMPLPELVNLWQTLNKQICRLIDRLPLESLSHKVTYGDTSADLKWLVTDYADHMDYHLAQILAEVDKKAELPCQVTLAEAQEALQNHPKPFMKLMEFADMEVEFYKPDKVDLQSPHSRDELYIISSGSGTFECNGQHQPIQTHDVLFVKAGDQHRFINFTDDFSTWVIFYGLEGEEKDFVV